MYVCFSIISIMFYFMTTKKYDSVTPYGFFHDDQGKMTVSPLMFHLIKTSVLPLMFFSRRPIKNDSVTPYVSFDKNDSVTPHVSFDKNDSVTPHVSFD